MNILSVKKNPDKALRIKRFNKPPQEPDEFIEFVVVESGVNLNDYLFYDNTYDDQHGSTNALRHMFRFPPHTTHLDPGDIIRVYTQNSPKKLIVAESKGGPKNT